MLLGVFIVVAAAAGGGYYFLGHKGVSVSAQYKTPAEADVYVRFDMEAYDQISTNYWIKPGSYAQFNLPELPKLFELAAQKVSSSNVSLASTTRTGVAEMLSQVFATATSSDQKLQWARDMVILVTTTLLPTGRSGLLSDKQETALRQNVSNINPSKDLYQDLGLAPDATVQQVEAAYTQKEAALKGATTTEAKAEQQKIAYAHEVLAQPASKTLYDEHKIEPTAFNHVLGHTLYFNLSKISPTTLQEFALAVEAASTTPGLDSMVLDLRGNVGGSLDFVQNFLGLFIGQNQYAFDLFHQGDYQVQRTTLPQFDRLSRYKEIALLTDGMTQSTAEVTTAAFERFGLGHVVGKTTRGWGTVENTYPIEAMIDPGVKYSLLLVNSITLRPDNQPVEGRGVSPDVDVSKTGWQSQLSKYFKSPSLIQAILSTAKGPLQ